VLKRAELNKAYDSTNLKTFRKTPKPSPKTLFAV